MYASWQGKRFPQNSCDGSGEQRRKERKSGTEITSSQKKARKGQPENRPTKKMKKMGGGRGWAPKIRREAEKKIETRTVSSGEGVGLGGRSRKKSTWVGP